MKKTFSVFGINVLIFILISVFLTACGQKQQDEGAGSSTTEATTEVLSGDGERPDTAHTELVEEIPEITILHPNETITTAPTITYICRTGVCSGKLSVPLKPFVAKLELGTLPISEHITLQNVRANMVVRVKMDPSSLGQIVNAGLAGEASKRGSSTIIKVSPKEIWAKFSYTPKGHIDTIITNWFKENIAKVDYNQPKDVATKLTDYLNEQLRDSPIEIMDIDFPGSIAEYVEVTVPVKD